jgi:hypothetical protein
VLVQWLAAFRVGECRVLLAVILGHVGQILLRLRC